MISLSMYVALTIAQVPSLIPHVDEAAILGATLIANDSRGRYRILNILSRYGPRATSSLPGVVLCLSDKDSTVAILAANLLAEMGKPALPTLIRTTREDNLQAKKFALRALGMNEGTRHVPEAQKVLIGACDDRSSGIREQAAQALGFLKIRAGIPPLIRILENDKSIDARIKAAAALGKHSEFAVDVIPALISTLKSERTNGPLREVCGDALTWLGPPAFRSLIEIVREKSKSSADARRIAMQALSWNGSRLRMAEKAELLPLVTEAISDPDQAVRIGAIRLFVDVASKTPETLALLSSRIKVSKREETISLAWALTTIDRGNRDAVRGLIRSIESDDDSVKRLSIETLTLLGNSAREATNVVVRHLESKDKHIRFAAVVALGEISDDSKVVIDALRKVSESDPEKGTRQEAANGISRIKLRSGKNR